MKEFLSGSCSRGEAVFVISIYFLARPEWLDEIYKLGFVEEVLKVMRDEPNEYDVGRSLDPIGPGNKGGMTRLLQSATSILSQLAASNSTRSDALVKANVFDEIATMLRRVGDLRTTTVWGAGMDVLAGSCEVVQAVKYGMQAESDAGLVALKTSGVVEVIAALKSGRGQDQRGLESCHRLLNA